MDKDDFQPELPAFARLDRVTEFLQAWHGWRAGALLPRRSQVRLTDFPEMMRGTMLMDVHGPECMTFRYAGSLYQEMYGFDFTGLNYLDITAAEFRHIRAKRLWGVVAQPAAAVWTTPAVQDVGFVGASLPILADDPSHPPKIMQVLVPLRDLHHISRDEWAKPRDKVIFSDRFRYVDIGAGKPDTSVEA